MNARTVSQLGMVFLVSALAVLAFSVYRSSHDLPSRGLASLGTALMLLGIAVRIKARQGSRA